MIIVIAIAANYHYYVENGSGLSRTREGTQFSHMRVKGTYKEKVPKHLIIDSCNLKLNESVGQGDIVNVVSYVL